MSTRARSSDDHVEPSGAAPAAPTDIDRNAPSQSSAALTLRVAALLFGSGLCALVYQTAWQRQFQLVFGASAAASSAVLGIFLGGLGVGALILGRRVARHPQPLVFYGNLELFIALSAALTPFLLDLLSSIYLASGGSIALGIWGATALRLLIAMLVMGGPVLLMGGTLPAAARAIETERDQGRTRLALIYGLNTCGAVVGALLGTFFLFEIFGTRATLWIAALLNVAVALIARGLGRKEAPIAEDAAPEAGAPASASDLRPDAVGARPPRSGQRLAPARELWRARLALLTAAVSGFGFLLLELVWYRMLAPILGGSTFTFGLILSVALAGIGLGGYAYSRRPEGRPATLTLLGNTTALLALCVIVPFALGDTLAIYAALTRNLGSWSFATLVAAWASLALLVVFPAAAVSGYQFPLMFALLGRGRANVSIDIGRLYATNTIGSIAGALIGGFVLIPRLGATTAWQLVAILFVVTALGAFGCALAVEPKSPLLSAWTAAFAASTLVLSSARGPTAAFRHTPIGAGRVKLESLKKNALINWQRQKIDQVIWERDGIETAVAVTNGNGFAFSVNGKSDGSVFWDRGTQTMGGLLPALLHEGPHSALVIGLGTGMTAGWLGMLPDMARVDVAELEPAIGDVAIMAAPVNHDVMNQPNVKVHYVDGRELMLTSDAHYDLIISEPSNPYRSGIATLFTRDFYSVVRSRLAPGGVFGQWMQGYEIDARTIRSIARTLRSEFGSVVLWQTQGNDLLFVASEREQVYRVANLRERILTEPYKSALRRMWLVQDVEGVMSHFVAGARVVDLLAQHLDPPLNSDDKNYLEYALARSVGTQMAPPVPRLLALARELGLSQMPLDAAIDEARVEELRPRAWLISGNKFRGDELPDGARARAQAFAQACAGNLARVMERWESQPRLEPSDDLELFAVALGGAFVGKPSPYIDDLERLGYGAEAHLARGHLASRAGERKLAVSHYLAGVEAVRSGQIPLCGTPTQLMISLRKVADKTPDLARAALAGLMRGPLITDLAEGERVTSLHHLAFAQMDAPRADPAVCVAALGRYALEPIWDKTFLEKRLECLRRAGLPLVDQAEEELAEFMSAGAGELLPENPQTPSRQANARQ